ncbi:hypothetical protein GCM10009785_12590 [Brooklawnia cerclae]|uniref:HlyD family efflux transporter periplasmic adaptor subunit n=1 Tax=Brooklawnia cerclae TaxID=349934 RepID=UPI0031D99E21
MTWANRLRLFVGIVGVMVLVSALTVVFNQRQNQITSFTGQVTADIYAVGADHPGTVTEQNVDLGDHVEVGQELFTIQSMQLKEALAQNLSIADTVAYKVNANLGSVTYYSVVSGQVTELNARLGNSLSAGSSLATITADRQRYIEAKFRLVPRDYARVMNGAQARVILPNDQVVMATVTEVTVATDTGGTISTLRLTAPELENVPDALSSPGTPVTVIVSLQDTGPLAGVSDLFTDLLVKIGLR